MARKSLLPAVVAGMCAIATVAGLFIARSGVSGAPETAPGPLRIAVVDLLQAVRGSEVQKQLASDATNALKTDYEDRINGLVRNIKELEVEIDRGGRDSGTSQSDLENWRNKVDHLREVLKKTNEAKENARNNWAHKIRIETLAAALIVTEEVALRDHYDLVFKWVDPKQLRDDKEATAIEALEFFNDSASSANILYFKGPIDALDDGRIGNITGKVTASLQSQKYADLYPKIQKLIGGDSSMKAPPPVPPADGKTGDTPPAKTDSAPPEKTRTPDNKTGDEPNKTS
jgi:Skp family chaperone for outer membrane proteins